MTGIEIKNVHSRGDLALTIHQVTTQFGDGSVLDFEEILKRSLRTVLLEERSGAAKEFLNKPLDKNGEVFQGIFLARDTQEKALEAAAQAVWSAASGDEISTFETDMQRSEIVDFLVDNPSFVQKSVLSAQPITLNSLPKALSMWADDEENTCSQEQLEYLRGLCFFLNCQFGRALEILDPLARKASTLDTVVAAGEAALNIGQYSVALRHFEKALMLDTSDGPARRLKRALWMSNLGACYEELLESEQALKAYRIALQGLEGAEDSALCSLIRALILNNIGFSLMTISDSSAEEDNLFEAGLCFEEALAIRERLQDTDVNLAVVLFNVAELKRKIGESGEAVFYRDLAKGTLHRLETPNVLMASISNSEGNEYFDRGRYEEALVSFRKARAILSQHFGEFGVKSVLTTYSIAQTLEAMGDPEAEAHLRHAKRLALRSIDDRHHPIVRMIESDLKNPPATGAKSIIKKIFRRYR